MLFRKLVLSSLVCSLAACGGSKLSYNYTEGTPSTEASADSVIAASTPDVTINGVTYTSISDASTQLNGAGVDFVATTDTGARAAWQQGWTGKGVKVGLADNFNDNGIFDDHGDYVAIVAGSVAP
jgi:hypothetical protein